MNPWIIKYDIEIEGIYYGYELDGSSKTNKLVNPNPETYEEMASRVNHFTLATPKKVDILETTKNILDFCENKGFSKADLARTLKSFVEHHIKHMMEIDSVAFIGGWSLNSPGEQNHS